jgi:hypothetical protein
MGLISDSANLIKLKNKTFEEHPKLTYNKLYWSVGMGVLAFIFTQEIKYVIIAMQGHLWAWCFEYGMYLQKKKSIETEEE